jgi:hypothetical protein
MPLQNDHPGSLPRQQLIGLIEKIRGLSLVTEEHMLGTSPTLHEITAHHESSHAVTAVKLGVAFESVEMDPYQYTGTSGANAGGLRFAECFDAMLHSRNPADAADREEIEYLVIVAIAGEAGQAFLEKRPCDLRRPTASGDYAVAMLMTNWLFPKAADRDAFIERQTSVACKLVSNRIWDRQIGCVASQLRFLNEMSHDAVVAKMKIRGSVRARWSMKAKRKQKGLKKISNASI